MKKIILFFLLFFLLNFSNVIADQTPDCEAWFSADDCLAQNILCSCSGDQQAGGGRKGCYSVWFGHVVCRNQNNGQIVLDQSDVPCNNAQDYPQECTWWEHDISPQCLATSYTSYGPSGRDETPYHTWGRCSANLDWAVQHTFAPTETPDPIQPGTIVSSSQGHGSITTNVNVDNGHINSNSPSYHAGCNGNLSCDSTQNPNTWYVTANGDKRYTLSVTTFSGYSVSYSVCYAPGCSHPQNGNTNQVTIDSDFMNDGSGGGQANIVWTYSNVPTLTPTNSPTPTPIPAPDLSCGTYDSGNGTVPVIVGWPTNENRYVQVNTSSSFNGTSYYSALAINPANANSVPNNTHVYARTSTVSINGPWSNTANITCTAYAPQLSCGAYNSSNNTYTVNATWTPNVSANFYMDDEASVTAPYRWLNGAAALPPVSVTGVPAGSTIYGKIFRPPDVYFADPITCNAPPVCTAPTLVSPINNECVNSRPVVTAQRSGLANQMQFGWHASSFPPPTPAVTGSWIGTSSDNGNYTVNPNTRYYWSARAGSSIGSCLNSAWTNSESFTVDQSAPPIPGGRSLTCVQDPADGTKYYIRYSWNAVSDNSCKGLNSLPYWPQVSTDSTFNTVNSWWPNTWGNQTTVTSNSSIPGGTTVYGHIKSRDGFDNQSSFSSPNDTVTCPTTIPACPVPTLVALPAPYCYKNAPSFTTNRSGSANQIQVAVDTDSGFTSPWICNSGWQGNNPMTYVPGQTTCNPPDNFWPLTTNNYHWTARASSSVNACTISAFASAQDFGIDTDIPSAPVNPTTSYDSISQTATFSWGASSDTGCGTCATTPGKAPIYWIQSFYQTGLTIQWIDNNGQWQPNSCAAPSYQVTCNGHAGATIHLKVIQAKDTVDNISASNNTTTLFTCPGVPSNTPTTDPSKPTPTPTPPVQSWFKTKNTTFHKIGDINNSIPDPVGAFDEDDDTNRVFNTGNAGLVFNTTGTQNYGTGTVSTNGFSLNNYTQTSHISVTNYITYVKSKKEYHNFSNISDIQPNMINIYANNGDGIGLTTLTIDNAAKTIIETQLQKGPVVIIFNGNIVIDTSLNISNPGSSPKPLAILAAGNQGQIQIKSTATELGGVYIADAGIDLSYDAPLSTSPLKIKGNLTTTSTTATDLTKRKTPAASPMAPSLFIINDPNVYLNLLPYLSTSVYEWTQKNP